MGFPTVETGPRRWWHAFTAPGYRHVFAWRADGEDGTLVVNSLHRELEVIREPLGFAEWTRRQVVERQVWALLVPPRAAPPPPYHPPLAPLTCVEVVKHALGIRAPWIWTPRQLARALRRHGATPILPAPLAARPAASTMEGR